MYRLNSLTGELVGIYICRYSTSAHNQNVRTSVAVVSKQIAILSLKKPFLSSIRHVCLLFKCLCLKKLFIHVY